MVKIFFVGFKIFCFVCLVLYREYVLCVLIYDFFWGGFGNISVGVIFLEVVIGVILLGLGYYGFWFVCFLVMGVGSKGLIIFFCVYGGGF